MRKFVGGFLTTVWLMFLLSVAAVAEDGTSLTIYNGGFAAVREHLPLDLKSGINPFTFAGATTTLEPESVILRDPLGQHSVQILEQSYRSDPVSQGLLLSMYEGKTIDFLVRRGQFGEREEIVKGKVIRSGYVHPNAQNPYGGAQQPVIEVDGKLRFSLPGEPIFPDLGQDTVLKPTLNWLLQSDKPGAFNAELAYITNGMSWNADYNLVVPETGNVADVVGWITMHNNTGKTFENSRIRLMAGDVNKIQNTGGLRRDYAAKAAMSMNEAASAPVVTEKAFDEFHLYTLEHPTTLHEEETKQVEFVHAMGVTSQRIYVYDGMDGYYYYGSYVGDQPSYGTQTNKKVWVMQEFKNSKENGLGIALPKGRVRFYRRDSDGSLQFIGENQIDHTPKDETVRLYTGNTFDVVGERKQTDYHVDHNGHWADESFEIHVRNHKKEAVTVRVVEHLYRWVNWKITTETDQHKKTDSQTMEYHVTVAPDQEKVVRYTVHYSW
ncbi:conserved hypothetical protein [Candidatus Koribacter versatilis Ellin345]|uniref:DUF4139 domain-containing protein n=1 Tax=Koribacter versatilis (strain Ellin345) TaxID=204669 RepID=Q1IVT4_KORVE|nr:DUF4139 domain-containing protein [Candidatus Koribacter versatilis]ABF39016.1 conserved hypothetical protein [Candidatus Koribacter versatilis Ellin345]